MKPTRIRAYTPSDLLACRELYTLNEPGRFPEGVLPEFEETLQSGHTRFLIAERDGEVRGCGGIRIASERTGMACLSFGLVHPAWQRLGLGTTLLLARLAVLPKNYWTVIMSPIPASESFYQRFNFREYGRFTHPTGVTIPNHYVRLSSEARDVCAALLAQAGVVLDVAELSIPKRV